MCTPRDQHGWRATLAAEVRTAVGESKGRDKEGYTRGAYVTQMLRSAAATDVQTIDTALIAAINSLPSGGERVQLYRTVQDVTIAAKDTLTRNKCLRANISADVPRQTLGRILEWLMQRGYARDALRRG